MRTDPARTLELLRRLEAHGFDDSAFSLLHHFPDHSIRAHAAYCKKRSESNSHFEEGGTNSMVQHRLEIVLSAYEGGGFAVRLPELFRLLSRAALVEVPMRD